MDREKLIQGVIRRTKKTLVENLLITDLLDVLLAKFVISVTQDQEIKACRDTKGENHASDLFWTMVLNGEVAVPKFMDAMKEINQLVYEELEEGVENIRSGIWSMCGEPDLKGIKQILSEKYRNPEWSELRIIPDEENITTPLSERMLAQVYNAHMVQSKDSGRQTLIRQRREVCVADYVAFKAVDLQDILGKISSVERDANLTDLQPNLVQVLGIAGTGKTVAVKQLAWLWANNPTKVNYDLIFCIPVRDITRDGLMDVLEELGLLPESEKEALDEYLRDPEHARGVLFMLDGVDENDVHHCKDLNDLVTGRLYPTCTVLITARPEAKCLAVFGQQPGVKARLQGTDKESINRMLAFAVRKDSPQEIAKFKERCEETISDMSLLHIPLYLTVLCVVFRDDIARGLKCTKLKIPETTTQLFNVMMHVIIGRWLQKVRHPNIAIAFSHSPLTSDSTVPLDIKRVLHFIARVCYKGLLQRKYQFSDQDARDNYLYMEDIKRSGLFTVGRHEKGEIFFTKHKQIQEYLASLYLVSEGTEEPLFHKILQENRDSSLLLAMRDHNLISAVQFACGLSGKFLRSLLRTAASLFRLPQYGHATNLYYEAVLFLERNADVSDVQNLEGLEEVQHYLCHTEIKQFMVSSLVNQDVDIHEYEIKCLRKLVKILPCSLACSLLRKLYSVEDVAYHCVDEDPSGEAWSPSRSTLTLVLDQLQMQLLCFLRFPCVTSLVVKPDVSVGSIFVDMPALLGIFPGLKEIHIHCNSYLPYHTGFEMQRHRGKPSGELTDVHILFTNDSMDSLPTLDLPLSHWECLLQQPHLKHLQLDNTNFCQALVEDQDLQRMLWTQLQCFTLRYTALSEFSAEAVAALQAVLQASRATLRSCTLFIRSTSGSDVSRFSELFRPLKELQRLQLEIGWRKDHQADVLAAALPHLTSLSILITGSWVVARSKSLQAVLLRSHLLRCLFQEEGGGLPPDFTATLRRNGVKICYVSSIALWWQKNACTGSPLGSQLDENTCGCRGPKFS